MAGKSDRVTKLLLASWAPNTKSSYNSYIKQWLEYCKLNNISDPYKATFEQGTDFLAHLFYNKKYPYGTIAVARSALSAILPLVEGTRFGDHPLVSKVMKGIFKEKPSLPRYTVTYDSDILLKYLNSLPTNSQLLLDTLTKKLCTLLAILSGQRAQTIGAINLDFHHLDPSDTKLVFYIHKVLKTTRPKFHQAPLEFWAFPENVKLCPINCFKEYRDRTEQIRANACPDDKQLFISYVYPHLPVKPATLARYVTVFTAHSTRSASTSKANKMGLSLKEIAKAAGWTRESTFQKYYNLPISKNFGHTLLRDSAAN